MLVDNVRYVHTGYRQVLPARPSSVLDARESVALVLHDWGYRGDELLDAQTVASEIVTNAIAHGKCPCCFTFYLFLDHGCAVIDVRDYNPIEPQRRPVGDDSESGRGLMIITALSQSWGVIPEKDGKRVYARLPMPARERDEAAPGGA